MLRACDFLVFYLFFVNVLGFRVSGYDDILSYYFLVNVVDILVVSVEFLVVLGFFLVVVGFYVLIGNCFFFFFGILYNLGFIVLFRIFFI